jgi:WD40 repeat protein
MRSGTVFVALALAACAPPPHSPSRPPPPDAATPCSEAALVRARVPGLLAQGKLDRTVRVIREADLACPYTAGESRSYLLRALMELERWEAAEELARVVLQAPGSPDAASEANDDLRQIARGVAETPPSPDQARQRAMGLFAEARGKDGTPDAQRLIDRAVAVMERCCGKMDLAVRWPEFGGSAWLPDDRLVVSLGEGQSRIARLDTGEETPLPVEEWLVPEPSPKAPRVSPDGRSVLVDAARGMASIYRADTGKRVRLLSTAEEARRGKWSPDGGWFAHAHEDGRRSVVALLALDTGESYELTPPPLKEGGEHVVTIAIANRSVAARTDRGRLLLWELPTRRYLGAVEGLYQGRGARPEEHGRLEMSADGSVVAAWFTGPSKEPEIGLVDTAHGKRATLLRDPRCHALTFAMHPTKPELVVGAEGVLCEWSTRSSTLTRTVEPQFWQAFRAQYGGGHPAASALSPGEKKLQEKMPYEHVVYWGKEAKIALGVAYVGGGLFNDDGSVFVDARFAIGLDGVQVTGSSHTLEGVKTTNDLEISPSGTYVLECGREGRVWEAASGRVVRRFGMHEPTRAVFWGEAGITEIGERGTAFVWGPGGFVEARPLPLGLEHGYVVQGGSRALAVRSNGSGIDAALIEPHGAVFSLPAPADAFVTLPVGRASLLDQGPWAMSSDGRRLAVAGARGFVGIWDLEARAFLRRLAYPDPSAATSSAWKIALSPDGKELAVLLDNRLYRWDVDSGTSIATPASDKYVGLLYSPVTSELIARREGSTLEFWGKGATPRSRTLGKADGELLASADGRLVLVGTEDGLLILDETRKTSGHFAAGGDAVALSPNGEYLAVARFDSAIHILRASDGSERATIFPLPDDGGAVVQDDHGEVEMLPDGPKTRAMLRCHVASCLLPHEACEERLVTRGLWRSIVEDGGTRGASSNESASRVIP